MWTYRRDAPRILIGVLLVSTMATTHLATASRNEKINGTTTLVGDLDRDGARDILVSSTGPVGAVAISGRTGRVIWKIQFPSTEPGTRWYGTITPGRFGRAGGSGVLARRHLEWLEPPHLWLPGHYPGFNTKIEAIGGAGHTLWSREFAEFSAPFTWLGLAENTLEGTALTRRRGSRYDDVALLFKSSVPSVEANAGRSPAMYTLLSLDGADGTERARVSFPRLAARGSRTDFIAARDLNGDGGSDIVATLGELSPGGGRSLVAFDGDTLERLWESPIPERQDAEARAPVALHDVTGDMRADLLLRMSDDRPRDSRFAVISGVDGTLAYQRSGVDGAELGTRGSPWRILIARPVLNGTFVEAVRFTLLGASGTPVYDRRYDGPGPRLTVSLNIGDVDGDGTDDSSFGLGHAAGIVSGKTGRIISKTRVLDTARASFDGHGDDTLKRVCSDEMCDSVSPPHRVEAFDPLRRETLWESEQGSHTEGSLQFIGTTAVNGGVPDPMYAQSEYFDGGALSFFALDGSTGRTLWAR